MVHVRMGSHILSNVLGKKIQVEGKPLIYSKCVIHFKIQWAKHISESSLSTITNSYIQAVLYVIVGVIYVQPYQHFVLKKYK